MECAILCVAPCVALCAILCAALCASLCTAAIAHAQGQVQRPPVAPISPALRAGRFLAGRATAGGGSAAEALERARREHLALRPAMQPGTSPFGVTPKLNPLSTPWTALGPAQVASQAYGKITGRITAIAIDPADPTGNTVYLGTTGGGVWRSTNAAGPLAAVAFTALTDTLPVFSASAGTAVIPSLSIGAVSVGNGVVLAGTGDPNDASDSYYGAGLLRSADGGVTWTLIQQSQDGTTGIHSFVGLGVAGFAWSSATPALVVAAISQAAESTLVNVPNANFSVMGLYYSANSGATWQMATIADGSQIVQQPLSAGSGQLGNAATAVVWNAQRQRFYAAVRFHGYYESADGKSWTRLAHQPGTGLTTIACPTNPNATGNTSCPIFRGALAVQPSTGDTFALTVDSKNLDQGLWQDVCALSGTTCAVAPIAFANRLVSTPLEVGSGSTAIAQGDYNLTLSAVATGSGAASDTLLYAGTVDLFRCSLAFGCVLRNTTNAANGCTTPAMVAPAQHALATLANAGTGGLPLLYLGNDGGVWRSTDGVNQQAIPCSTDDATHFSDLNGGIGSLAEIVSFAQHPTDPATLLAGLGANGTASTAASGPTSLWPQIATGEGGTVAIDQATPANWSVSTQAGVSIRFCGKGSACAAADFAGASTIGYTQVSGDASLIDEPFLLDPQQPSNVILGTCRVWRGPAQTGASWPGANAISTLLGGPQNSACSATSNPALRSLTAGGPASGVIAAQNAGSTVLYAGLAGSLDGGLTTGGHVFANYAAGSATKTTAWTDIAKGTVTNDAANAGVFNPGGFDISSVTADTHDATGKTVYATVMGFAGNGVNAPHVYRSLDGGAHWTNISSNLPNAPANALLIDPNDANTLYVAQDTGVYVTTGVATCTSANCWSVYGTGLPNAPAVGLAAASAMPVGDGRFGELRVATYGRGLWQIPLLTASFPAAPLLSLSPVALTFGTQAVATASALQTVTVTNSGNAALTVSQVSVTGDFTASSTCIGSPVPAGATCTVQVGFLPTLAGTRTGVLTVYGNVAGGQATVSLTGTGAPPATVILNPITLTFTQTDVGSTSAAQNITISNTGGTAATLATPTVTGDFKLTANTCGSTLGPSVGCTVSIAFAPTTSGTRTGSLTVVDSVGTQTASFTGVGNLAATDSLSPLTLVFVPQQQNTSSSTQTVTLSNAGDAPLTLIAATVTGDFTVVNGCGNSLNGHSTCTLLVASVPKSVGPSTGVLTVSDVLRAQTVALSGSGVAPPGVSLSPFSALAFPATPVGSTSAPQVVILTNNGGVPLAIAGTTLTGDFLLVAGSNTCGAALPAGSACTIQIAFAPTLAGARAGSFAITDNAATSPQSLSLTGSGVDFSLVPNGNTSATVTAGTSAVFPLLLSSVAGVPGTVAFTCGPVPAHATCLVVPSAPALGSTTTISVTVATSVAGIMLRMPWERQAVWLAAALPLMLFGTRRRLSRLTSSSAKGVRVCLSRCCGVTMLASLTLLASCGASRIIPLSATSTTGGGSTVAPTPAGTYNFAVTGTSSGLTRTVNLTLIVQ